MPLLTNLTIALAAVSGLLALVLTVVYARNHRQVRSPFTLGLVLFAVFLVVHSLVSIYNDVTMMAEYTERALQLRIAEGLLGLVALSALAWSTMR